MSKRKVVVTGAAGYVAGRILDDLHQRFDLTLLDVRDTNRDGEKVPGIQIADLLNTDRDTYRQHFRGADAIIHFSFIQTHDRSQVDHYFQNELNNIQMAYNIYQTAWEENVRRVVVASSNHAADYYERLFWANQWDMVDPEDRPLSDNYYGWAKEAYEHLGFVFATGRVTGRPLENVQIRIGGPRDDDVERAEPGDMHRARRGMAVYFSARDMAQMFIKSVETEDIRDQYGVPFQIFYGISDNSQKFWSIANARKIINYEPQDNSEYQFAEAWIKHVRAMKEDND